MSEEKNCMQHKCNRKLMVKKGKNILPTRLLEKKVLMIRNHPPYPSRVKWSAPHSFVTFPSRIFGDSSSIFGPWTVYTSSSQSDWRTVERSIRILLKTKHDKKQLFVSEKLRMKDFSSIDFKDNVRFVVRRYLKTIGIKVPKLKGQKIQVSDAVLLIRCKDYMLYEQTLILNFMI